MANLLTRAARFYGNRTAIIDGDWSNTWSEYVERIARAAGVLTSLGIRPGELPAGPPGDTIHSG